MKKKKKKKKKEEAAMLLASMDLKIGPNRPVESG